MALAVVAAAGFVGVLLIRMLRAAPANAAPMAGLPPLLRNQPLTLPGVKGSAMGSEVKTFSVATSAIRIAPATAFGFRRRVTLSTDQAVRVSNSADVSSTNGFYVPAAQQPWNWPRELRSDETLWAIRAGASDALLTVLVEAGKLGE